MLGTSWRGFCGTAIVLVGLASMGCGGKASVASATRQNPNPLPLDTLTTPVAQIGTYGGRFILAQTNPPRTFNPVVANETSTTDVTDGRLFAGLVDFDNASQTMQPRLAKSWESSPDGLFWTFHLRRGAAFSDGHPISADDVLFSFRVYMDDTLHVSVYDFLKVNGQKLEVAAPDSYTVTFKLAGPYALLVAVMGSVYVMPKHVLEPAYLRGAFSSAYSVSTPPDSIVTSGPWRLKQYVPNERTVLEPNPFWCGVDAQGQRLPYLDELVFSIVPDQNTAGLRMQAGEVDAVDNVKPEDYQAYEANTQRGNYTLYDLGPALNTNFFFFNLNKVRTRKPGKTLGQPYVGPVEYAWFSNPVFRRAVSMAIDRDAIIRSAFYGHGVKNWSTTTPGNKVWHTPDIVQWDYNPEESKRLLAGLGWKDGNGDGFLEDTKGNTISFNLKTNGDNNIRVAMCNFIKDDLAQVGIRCLPTPVDFNTLVTNFRQDFQYEAGLLGLQSATPPDPGMGQNVWRSSGLTHYWNIKQPSPETEAEAKVDALVSANVATNDMVERKRTWKEIQDLINQECFIIWLPTLSAKVPVSNRFGNLHPTVIPHRILWNIHEVFLKPRATGA